MDPIQRSVTFFFPLKTNQKHLFTINLYFYTIWRKQQHVNRKSLYSVAMKQKLQKSYIFIYISSAKHTHWKANEKHTNKTVNCNEKKSIAVNILYTHTKTHKKSFHDNKCQQNKQQIRLFHFPSHTHPHIRKTSFMQMSKEWKLTLSSRPKSIENTKQTGCETVVVVQQQFFAECLREWWVYF